MRSLVIFCFTALVVGLLPACTGTHDSRKEHLLATEVQSAKAAPIVDVPALVGASIDELARQMGPAGHASTNKEDPVVLAMLKNGEPIDSVALFRSQGLELVATYDHQSRRVSDLLLIGPDEDELMMRANLRLNAEKYLILPVFQVSHPSQLLGLRVVAK